VGRRSQPCRHGPSRTARHGISAAATGSVLSPQGQPLPPPSPQPAWLPTSLQNLQTYPPVSHVACKQATLTFTASNIWAHATGVPTPTVSARVISSQPISYSLRVTNATKSWVTCPRYGQPNTQDTPPRILILAALAAWHTGWYRSKLSMTLGEWRHTANKGVHTQTAHACHALPVWHPISTHLQLMFFIEKASDAAVKMHTSVAPASTAWTKP
jgi:hypothetical protein